MARKTKSSDYKKAEPVISIQAPVELKAKMLSLAKKDHIRSLSTWIRVKLSEYVEAYEKQHGEIIPTADQWERAKPNPAPLTADPVRNQDEAETTNSTLPLPRSREVEQ